MSRRATAETALLVVALVGAASIARLTADTTTWRAALLTALVGEVVTAAAARRFSTSWTVLTGAVAVALTALWVSVPGATRYGLPTVTTLHVLGHALRAVGAIHFPVASRTGVVLLGSVLSGMAAVATRVLPGSVGLAPTVALVAASTVAVPSKGSDLLAVLLAAAGGAVLLSRAPRRGWPLGAVTTVAAVLCVLLVGVFTGPAPASGGGIAVQGVPPTALSLVSRLTGLEIRDPDLVMFTADTPIPTYWQVASLSVLRGGTWMPDAATAAALQGLGIPATPAPSAQGPTFTVTVTVANLSSRLLPVPPSTTDVPSATLTNVGVVAPEPTGPGQSYRATALVPEIASGPGTLPPPPASIDGDTELPTLPPVVSALARSVTASASTPLDKAEALTNWFRSDLFHYSLRSTPASLVSFLTSSRTGTCEQFAGAFAVLARSIGLPTRVAVGFTSGVRDPAGQTVVRGLDAHAWPEVFLGGSWMSFEPTPGRPSGELSPPGVIGLTAVGNPNPVSPPTIPTSIPPTSLPLPVQPSPTRPVTQGSDLSWWLVLGLGIVLMLVVTTLLVLLRRRRRTPDEQLVMAWRRVDRALDRGAMARPPWRTPVAHTRLIRSGVHDHELDAVLTELEWLATHLEATTYGGSPADASDVQHARMASRRVAKALATMGPRH